MMKDKNIILTVSGMSCRQCVSNIEKAVGSLNGVSGVNVDLNSRKVSVEFDNEKLSLNTIKDVIEDQGYEVKEKKP
ncbi:MAG: copper chaperone CopZ [Acetivibrionales bacterium]|jgi:copper chaperone